jgi:hypothetical protein
MDRAILTAFAIAALLPVVAPANRAMAITPERMATAQEARSIRLVDFVCDRRCARRWPPRQYWQWDQRPIWDDPWTTLQPTIWGSPEPYLVPADRWAHEWHPPWIRHWHSRHPY